MVDRVPTKPNRYAVYDDAHNFIRYEYHERADEPTQEGTPLNKSTFFGDSTAALYVEGATTPDEAFNVLARRTSNSLARDLNIMLNLSLGTSNIDAWADLLSNSSLIQSMSGAMLSGGALSVYSATLSHPNSNSTSPFGRTDQPKIGQSFVAPGSGYIKDFEVTINKYGNPSDGVVAKLYQSDKTTLIAASNVVDALSISGVVHFAFPNNAIVAFGTSYFISIERTGSANNSAYYELSTERSGTYENGNMFFANNSGTWTQSTSDIRMVIIVGVDSASVVWKPVTSTEPFVAAAVSLDAVIGSGHIACAVSDDGANWVEIDAPDLAQPVNFTNTSVYLKATLTGDAILSGIAWGGY